MEQTVPKYHKYKKNLRAKSCGTVGKEFPFIVELHAIFTSLTI